MMSAVHIEPNHAPNFAPLLASKPPRARKTTKHPDHVLVRNCVEYVGCMKGADAGYEADSCNDDVASILADELRRRAFEALPRVTRAKAKTMEGLRAKAAVAKVIAHELDYFAATKADTDFLRSFAADVIRFQRTQGGLA